MPLIKLYSSAQQRSAAEIETLLQRVSSDVAALIGKPERYVMTCMLPRVEMTFGGSGEACAYAEVKSIGTMSAKTTAALSGSICATLSEILGVSQERIYIEFQDAEPHLWGHDGGTFA